METMPQILSLGVRERDVIERKFNDKRKLAAYRGKELFGIFGQALNPEEEWALKFLYANMPLNDLADVDGELYLSHVRRTLAVRSQVPWGERVPDGLFLHYVLPLRINNENLEDYGGVLYAELAPRTVGLTMQEAILETNYWCHEKATYIGSDLRTLSPLAMIRNARGRCGEESTLAVAALRSIGIPARQCYTPRWAHCDDNHAWVEAWADGKWHYIGACEPEARLDEGWFSGPARRTMLVHTRVPADYSGPETVTFRDEWHTEINLLDHYAPVRMLEVQVVDGRGTPVPGAGVHFLLYNYAELFPLAVPFTDEEGRVSFKTGYGGLVIRAVKDGMWGETETTAADGPFKTIILVLGRTGQPEGEAGFDMAPPPEREGEIKTLLDEGALERHRERVAEGERLRKGYEAAFIAESRARELAVSLALPEERTWCVLETARGNGPLISAFLSAFAPELGLWPLRLLESLNPKDLTDISRETLDDYMTGAMSSYERWVQRLEEQARGKELPGLQGLKEPGKGPAVGEWLEPKEPEQGTAHRELHEEQAALLPPSGEWPGLSASMDVPSGVDAPGSLDLFFDAYVLRPRVQYEMLAPYRQAFASAFSEEEIAAFRDNPALLVGRVAEEWDIRDDRTHMKGKATPAGTFRLKRGDRASAEIMLVALMRSFGIPARLHPASQTPQYAAGQQWIDARLADREQADAESGKRGTLRLMPGGEPAGDSPVLSYRENFTIARLEDGVYTTITYPAGEKRAFEKPVELEPGAYRLIAGVRLRDGTVLGRFHYFVIEPGRETVVAPSFRKPAQVIPVLGKADSGTLLQDDQGDGLTLSDLAGSRGAVLAWIDPRREPSRHLLREAGELKAEYEAAGLPLLFAVPDGLAEVAPEGDSDSGGLMSAYPQLPSCTRLLRDAEGRGHALMAERLKPGEGGFPHLYVLDGELSVRYAQSGYKPGSGKEALQTLLAVRTNQTADHRE